MCIMMLCCDIGYRAMMTCTRGWSDKTDGYVTQQQTAAAAAADVDDCIVYTDEGPSFISPAGVWKGFADLP